MRPVFLIAAIVAVTLCNERAEAARRVVFVDGSRVGGVGTYEEPYGKLADAQHSSGPGDVIFVAEMSNAYEESFALKKGQMLIGSGFGLDAVRGELKTGVIAPPMPAAQGTGPVIHGTITLAGDNVIAGCTLIADRKNGVAVSATSPQGPITLRALYLRTSSDGYGLYVDSSDFPVTWTNGRLDASDHGSGILINGGSGDVTIDHVPFDGEFGTGISIRGRSGGNVVFRNGSRVSIRDASHEALTLTQSRGSIIFESPLQVATRGGRGLVVKGVERVAVSGGTSWVETKNGAAVDVRNAGLDIVFDRVSAEGIAPGRVVEAIVLDKAHGRFEITGNAGEAASGGVIRNALSYGIRITQSTGVHLRNLSITGGGSVSSMDDCPADIPSQTNVRCSAALYLRHVESSTFENITITDNAGVGLNVNNATDLTFADVHISGTGDQASEPALLIDEARGTLSFTRCSFADGGGGAVVVEQQFNTALIALARCDISAPRRPGAGTSLVCARTTGGAKLTLQLTDTSVHDHAAAGVLLGVSERGAAVLIARGSRFERLGSTAINVSAADKARLTVMLARNQVIAPAVREPLVTVRVADEAAACVDVSENELVGGGSPVVRISGAPRATIQVVVTAGVTASDSIRQRNGGVSVAVTDATAITSICP